MARQSKGTPRSRAWFDGFEGIDPRDSSDSYAADYREGQAERVIRHERLNAVCAAARRTDELLKREYATRGPVQAEFMGEVRELVGVNGMA
jgi:hypothetical protein